MDTLMFAIRSREMAFGFMVALVVGGCDRGALPLPEAKIPRLQGDHSMEFVLLSEAFDHNTEIPRKYTGEGDDVSPALFWENPPAGTQAFALICEDPDAPQPKPWVHWVIYGISAEVSLLPEAIP